jgi:hypothetical protein
MDITVSNVDGVIADLSGVSAKSLRAAVWAMNRAIVSGQVDMAREIAGDTGLKVGDVKKQLPTSQATYSNPRAAFGAPLERIPLIYFKAKGPEPSRGRGSGVSYALTGGRRRVAESFIATMRSGHRGVFKRVGKAGSRTGRIIGAVSGRKSRGAWGPNLPIAELFGPSLGHVFAKYRPKAITRTEEAFDKLFDHEFARLAEKQGSTGG